MKRIVLLIAAGFGCAGTGCDKSPDHGRKAELASANGLMPGPAPTYEEIYVVDQAQVKSAPKRMVSYEPLESFGSGGGKKAAPAEAKEEESPKSKKSDAKTSAPKTQKPATPKAATPKSAVPKAAAPAKTPPAPAKSPAKPSGSTGSFWKNVGAKAMMGGGPPATGGNAAKPAPPETGKNKSKTAKSDAKADDEKSADDEEEKSDDEEKDSDEEGDDSGKDDKKDNDGG